jgi:hypothetical protein
MLSHHNAHHGGTLKFANLRNRGLGLKSIEKQGFFNFFSIVTLHSGVDSRWRNFPTIKKTMVVHHVSNHTDQTCPKRMDNQSLDFILWKTSFSSGLGK